MQQDVFVDLLFLINFSMDYLCLFISSKILHRKLKFSKTLLASIVGGAYSVISVFLIIEPLLSIIIDVFVCLMICAICFAQKNQGFFSLFLSFFLFLGVSMMTGGCMTAIFNLLNRLDLPLDGLDGDSISTYLFAIVATVAGLICLRHGQIVSRRSSITECSVCIKICNKDLEFKALADSGNLVKDPLSGKTVILLDRNKMSSEIDISPIDSFSKGSFSSSAFRGLRLIPINTAGGKGILTAFEADSITITYQDKKGRIKQFNPDSLIALTEIENSAEGYEAIIPIEIIKF